MDLAVDQTGAGNRAVLKRQWAEIGLRPVTNLALDGAVLAQRRCGRIVTSGGRLQAVYGRWWPHLGNMLQVLWEIKNRSVDRDRCELFYHQPLSSPDYLTLSYVHAGPATSMSTLYAAGLVLDEIARVKNSNAIVSQITNDRISDRALHRWGWVAHCEHLAGRNFIKRFYGNYPAVDAEWRRRLTLPTLPTAKPAQNVSVSRDRDFASTAP